MDVSGTYPGMCTKRQVKSWRVLKRGSASRPILVVVLQVALVLFAVEYLGPPAGQREPQHVVAERHLAEAGDPEFPAHVPASAASRHPVEDGPGLEVPQHVADQVARAVPGVAAVAVGAGFRVVVEAGQIGDRAAGDRGRRQSGVAGPRAVCSAGSFGRPGCRFVCVRECFETYGRGWRNRNMRWIIAA